MSGSNYSVIIIILVILFILGAFTGLRVSPREKALGLLREKARKMGLHPRLIAAPDWTGVPKASDKLAGMVAYYSILIPDGKYPLMRAIVKDGQLSVITGDTQFDGREIALKGIYAVDMQANCIGAYWDESTDFHGEQLENLKQYLHSLAQQHDNA